jgi:hypothetical protein
MPDRSLGIEVTAGGHMTTPTPHHHHAVEVATALEALGYTGVVLNKPSITTPPYYYSIAMTTPSGVKVKFPCVPPEGHPAGSVVYLAVEAGIQHIKRIRNLGAK